MGKLILILLICAGSNFVSVKLKAQSFKWVNNQTHNIPFNPDFAAFPSAVDNNGNSLLASLKSYKLSWSQSYLGDFSLIKYDRTGSLIFSKSFFGKLLIDEVQTAQDNDIYISGLFMDTLKIDSVNTILNTGTGFNINYFIIKLNQSGELVWKKNISSEYSQNFNLAALRVIGNELFAGISSFNQIYIKKFNASGIEVQSYSITSNNTLRLSSIDTDPQGNLIAGGSCGMGNINFGGLTAAAPNVYNIFIGKISPTGKGVWVKFVQDITFQEIFVVCDNNGNTFAAGDLFGSFMFGKIQSQGNQWVYDFFLTKIDPSGNFLWLKEVPHTSVITGDVKKSRFDCIEIDIHNNIYFTGFLRGSMNWGNGVTTVSAGSNDALILKYDEDGNILFGKTAGGPGSDRVDEISSDGEGNLIISGNFSSTAFFDSLAIAGSGSINSFITLLSDKTNPGCINLSAIIEGFYDTKQNVMRLKDTLMIYMRNSSAPFELVDSAVSISDTASFTSSCKFYNAVDGNYYLQIKHRNTIETWSSSAVSFIKGGTINYDLTGSQMSAYGNNLAIAGESPLRYALYSGDTDQDDIIDLTDLLLIFNDAGNFTTGYNPTDVNGDNITDLTDLIVTYKNSKNLIGLIRP